MEFIQAAMYVTASCTILHTTVLPDLPVSTTNKMRVYRAEQSSRLPLRFLLSLQNANAQADAFAQAAAQGSGTAQAVAQAFSQAFAQVSAMTEQ